MKKQEIKVKGLKVEAEMYGTKAVHLNVLYEDSYNPGLAICGSRWTVTDAQTGESKKYWTKELAIEAARLQE